MRIKTETAVGLFIIVSTLIFLYMSYQLGSFRFDKIKYNTYSVYFNDISGLSKKSDVKIAGVKVGWVDAVDLINESQQVKATIMIDKKYQLYSNAHAVVRQEGLLGSKYLELNPGDPLLPTLSPGSMLTRPSTGPVAVDQMLRQFKGIASNLELVTDSMRGAIGGPEGEEKLRALVNNLQQATEKFASLSNSFDRVVSSNEGNINDIFNDFRTVLQDLKNEIPRLSQNLQNNFDRMALQLENVGRPVGDIAQKISEGQGVLGQLVNDEVAARDLRSAISGVRTYFSKIDRIAVIFDIHTESMIGPFQHHCFNDNKGYVNFRIHPTEDYFYLAGIVSAQSGRVERIEKEREWFQTPGHQLIPPEMVLEDWAKLKFAPFKVTRYRFLDKYLWNLQLGKIYGNFAFRVGLFDSTGGVGVDIDLPLGSDSFRWVTTFEAYDWRGRNRLGDDRPHLKWLNRMFLSRNLYFTFGADDFVSRDNKNAFFGVGIRFADDDIKYLISRTSIIL